MKSAQSPSEVGRGDPPCMSPVRPICGRCRPGCRFGIATHYGNLVQERRFALTLQAAGALALAVVAGLAAARRRTRVGAALRRALPRLLRLRRLLLRLPRPMMLQATLRRAAEPPWSSFHERRLHRLRRECGAVRCVPCRCGGCYCCVGNHGRLEVGVAGRPGCLIHMQPGRSHSGLAVIFSRSRRGGGCGGRSGGC